MLCGFSPGKVRESDTTTEALRYVAGSALTTGDQQHEIDPFRPVYQDAMSADATFLT